jgi:hypothetical protein
MKTKIFERPWTEMGMWTVVLSFLFMGCDLEEPPRTKYRGLQPSSRSAPPFIPSTTVAPPHVVPPVPPVQINHLVCTDAKGETIVDQDISGNPELEGNSWSWIDEEGLRHQISVPPALCHIDPRWVTEQPTP